MAMQFGDKELDPPDDLAHQQQFKASFKDKLLGSQVSNDLKVDLIENKLFRI
ncbi:hypothetical protein SESBI_42017 [Sesbania bispinosa]|nr:hypothetical protein SESBI_42017 [Sesbania bispinosa]